MADFKETAVEYLDCDSTATFCSSERKWINKMMRLSKSYPDEVKIIYAPEDNGGVILAHIPKSWLKISPKRTMTLTDEQRAAAAERMHNARAKKGE